VKGFRPRRPHNKGRTGPPVKSEELAKKVEKHPEQIDVKRVVCQGEKGDRTPMQKSNGGAQIQKGGSIIYRHEKTDPRKKAQSGSQTGKFKPYCDNDVEREGGVVKHPPTNRSLGIEKEAVQNSKNIYTAQGKRSQKSLNWSDRLQQTRKEGRVRESIQVLVGVVWEGALPDLKKMGGRQKTLPPEALVGFAGKNQLK